MVQSNKKLVITIFSLIILAEVLSFVTYSFPFINSWIFGAVVLGALALTVWKLEWGVYLIFTELVIGSFGKLFVLQIGGVELSIRIVLWLIVMSVWLGRVLVNRAPHPSFANPRFAEGFGKARASAGRPSPLPKGEGIVNRVAFFHSQFFKPYLILAVVLGWGIVWGWARGHDFGAVFFDVNNYLYFLLIFPVYEVLAQKRDAMNRVFTILSVAIAWLAIKTIVLFYIFSHELFGLQDVLYAWSRKFQLAEITNISPLYLTSRIFMQSQVWVLFGLFVVLGYFLSLRGADSAPKQSQNQTLGSPRSRSLPRVCPRGSLAMTIILSAALIMSLSRSFWLAGIIALALLVVALLFAFRERIMSVLRFSLVAIGVLVLAVGLTLGVAVFPVPRGVTGGSAVFKERVEKFSSGAAASSRYSQIRPLLAAIAKHPAIGSGFGQAVTYQSQDPRVVKSHPDGWYTTTAFELGWLEMWLKIGLVGVGVYLYLLWKILKVGWQKIKATRISEYSDRYVILGAILGLIAIVITHGVSPYLNHPLGIGIVLLVTALIDKEN